MVLCARPIGASAEPCKKRLRIFLQIESYFFVTLFHRAQNGRYSTAVASYRCVATSVEGFVQQLACSYLRHGYWFYVVGKVPDWKDPCAVDAKLLARYEIAVSESTRSRRKKLGHANLQYLRFQRLFVILATQGRHRFKEIEAGAVRDIRRVPIKFHGYSISYRPGGRTRSGEKDPRWHSHVEIERERYKEIRDHLVELSVHRSAQELALQFYRLPFEPYAPIRRQMLNILRAVNRRRNAAGYSLLPPEVLPLRRRIVRPFGLAAELTVEQMPASLNGRSQGLGGMSTGGQSQSLAGEEAQKPAAGEGDAQSESTE